MLKSYEAIYDNGQLNWLGEKPVINKTRVIVVIEEDGAESHTHHSIRQLKGLAPKPKQVISIEEMNAAIELEGAKR